MNNAVHLLITYIILKYGKKRSYKRAGKLR